MENGEHYVYVSGGIDADFDLLCRCGGELIVLGHFPASSRISASALATAAAYHEAGEI